MGLTCPERRGFVQRRSSWRVATWGAWLAIFLVLWVDQPAAETRVASAMVELPAITYPETHAAGGHFGKKKKKPIQTAATRSLKLKRDHFMIPSMVHLLGTRGPMAGDSSVRASATEGRINLATLSSSRAAVLATSSIRRRQTSLPLSERLLRRADAGAGQNGVERPETRRTGAGEEVRPSPRTGAPVHVPKPVVPPAVGVGIGARRVGGMLQRRAAAPAPQMRVVAQPKPVVDARPAWALRPKAPQVPATAIAPPGASGVRAKDPFGVGVAPAAPEAKPSHVAIKPKRGSEPDRMRARPTIGQFIRFGGREYVVERSLGKGSFGEAFSLRATQPSSRRGAVNELVVKFSDPAGVQEAIDRFARAKGRPARDNPAAVLSNQMWKELHAQGLAYKKLPRHFPKPIGHFGNAIAMEKVQGKTLGEVGVQLGRLVRSGQITAMERMAVVQEIGRQALRAVGAMEKVGVVHRDLSGNNIMLDNTGTVKIIDFGAAKVPGTNDRMLLDAYVYGGTPGFYSANVKRAMDARQRLDGSYYSSSSRDDVFSVARSLFYLSSASAFFRVAQAERAARTEGRPWPGDLTQRELHPDMAKAVNATGLGDLLRKTTAGGGTKNSELSAGEALAHSFFRLPVAGVDAGRVSEILSELGR